MKNFTKKLFGKWPLRKPRRKCYDILRWILKGMGFEGMACR
jgi:hypothetical protein